jgi:hypothetical protein
MMNLRNNFNNTLPFYNFSPSKAQRDNTGDTSDTTTQGLCIHLTSFGKGFRQRTSEKNLTAPKQRAI